MLGCCLGDRQFSEKSVFPGMTVLHLYILECTNSKETLKSCLFSMQIIRDQVLVEHCRMFGCILHV